MRYWPLSAIAQSPMMPWRFSAELYSVQVRHKDEMTVDCVNECGRVACHIEPVEMPGLRVIVSTDRPGRRMYDMMPTIEEWALLERAGILQDDDGGLVLHIDALH